MTLNLDLSASDAKIDRAEEHMKALKTEVAIATEQRHPHTIRGDVDPDTGWCSVKLRRNKPKEPRLAAIAGDYVHNLRSALNYIVTALVDATPGISLATYHQFPIYDDPTTYADKVWRPGEQVGRGDLKGVIYGLAIIEPLQPYHTTPDSGADPLSQLNRFSNTDKHREIIGYWADPQPAQIELSTAGNIIGQLQRTDRQQWTDDEVEIGRVQLAAHPAPTYLRAKAEMAVVPLFSVQPFRQYTQGLALDLATLEAIGTQVRLTTDLFKTI